MIYTLSKASRSITMSRATPHRPLSSALRSMMGRIARKAKAFHAGAGVVEAVAGAGGVAIRRTPGHRCPLPPTRFRRRRNTSMSRTSRSPSHLSWMFQPMSKPSKLQMKTHARNAADAGDRAVDPGVAAVTAVTAAHATPGTQV